MQSSHVTRRRIATSVAALVALGVAPARVDAQLIQYYTVGRFICAPCAGSGTGSAVYGLGPSAITLAFSAPIGMDGINPASAANPAQVNLGVINPSFASFGSLDATGGSAVAASALNGTFELSIFQVLPSGGSGQLVGSLSGSLANGASGATFDASAAGTVNIGGVNYRYQNLTYAIVPPTTNAGVTSLQGVISAQFVPAVVPEPATITLIGGGLVAMGLVARRRRTRTA